MLKKHLTTCGKGFVAEGIKEENTQCIMTHSLLIKVLFFNKNVSDFQLIHQN